LIEGCRLIGGPQVRNVATIGGNVAHALPAGDGTIALHALDAQAQLASTDGLRWVPIQDLFAGPGKAAFDRSTTLVVGFKIGLKGPREGSAFRRVMRPQGVAIAILNMSCWLRLAEDGSIETIRLAVGPGGPTPFRARQTETVLAGRTWGEEAGQIAGNTLLDEVSLRTSRHRATETYRRHLSEILLRRTVEAALEQVHG
jgi:carbon-monoxide dehydrogenase medium subunit